MDLVDALQSLARQRGRGDNPLVALRTIAARPGARISHLPISQSLAQAWVTVTGEPFHQHQSLALASLRRGEPLALVGGHAARQTLHLLTVELLRSAAPATAIVLAPDEQAAAAQRAGLARIAAALGEPLRLGLAFGDEARAATAAHLVFATPRALHERMLRYHERAWAAFWSRLRLVVIPEAHTYDGIAAANLRALLLRAARVSPGEAPPQLAATIAPVAAADEALALIGGAAWRIIPADDGPAPATALALWRAPGERAREAVALALALARAAGRANERAVHLICPSYEAPLLRALVGPEETAISVGPSPLPAPVQIFVGLAGAAPYLRQTLDGAALVALVLGDDPAERALARLAAHDPEQIPLFDGPPPTWVAAGGNAYVAAQQLVCAASEAPLAEAELEAWQATTIVPRLEERGLLVSLPGPEPAWQPLSTGDNPYESFDMRGAGTPPAAIAGEHGPALGSLDQATFDRWGFVGAALPPVRGGYRVVARDDEGLRLTLRQSPEARRTMPLRHCNVRVRDRRERRTARGRELAWGRVVVVEEVYGYREASPGSAPAERALNPPLSAEWSAPALWIDLPGPINVAGQLIGWSLAAALPLRTLGALTDLVPAYDGEANRLYFIDAQPGGSGLAVWLYGALDELLPLAYDVALDCRNDPLLEPLARADMDWLLALLGGAPVAPAKGQRARGEGLPAPADERRQASPPPPPIAFAEWRVAGEDEPAPRAEPEAPGADAGDLTMPRFVREREGRERADRRQVEPERPAREVRAERERIEREEQERAARAKQEREEQERIARAKQEREEQEREAKAERERLAQAAREREEQEREARAERERAAQAERERKEREAQERKEREAQERKERAAWEAQERAAREAWETEQRRAREVRERLERETREREAKEREAKERAEREIREARERAERAAKAEQARLEREAKEQAEREAREREIREARLRAERAEQERLAREREAEEARLRAERAEQERLAREQAAAEARARAEQAEQERLEREQRAERAAKAEQERLEREGRARARAERAEQERLEREQRAEAARLEREQQARASQAPRREPPPPPGPRRAGRNADPPQGSGSRQDGDRQGSRQGYQRSSQQPPRPEPPRREPPRPEPPRREPPRAEPPRREAPRPEPTPEPEVMPDAAAMVERLRRMRAQREGNGRAAPPRQQRAQASSDEAGATRFNAGDQIVCTPYGRGEVLGSRLEGDRELIEVAFPEHGRLTIDAAVNAARRVDAGPSYADDDPAL